MDFDYTESEQSFRQEVQDFLRKNLPPKKDRDENFLKTWLEKVREKGWVGFSWAKSVRRIRWRTHRTSYLERGNGTRKSPASRNIDDGISVGWTWDNGIRNRGTKEEIHTRYLG